MGLFNRKKKPETTPESNLLLAMPMFNNGESFYIDKVIAYLASDWGVHVTDIDRSSETVSFTIQDELVILAKMPAPIPWGDIEGTAQYAYNWSSALKDLEKHNSHVLVTILSSNTSQKERFTILTKVLAAILATSDDCIGIYQGTQSLLIPKDQYLDSAEALKQNFVPLDLWVYIGMRRGAETNSAYSYGLKAFGKMEMEFIDAPMDLEELHHFISQICGYVINSDVTFKNGETLGFTAEQKIKITQSKGTFVEGESFKLTF